MCTTVNDLNSKISKLNQAAKDMKAHLDFLKFELEIEEKMVNGCKLANSVLKKLRTEQSLQHLTFPLSTKSWSFRIGVVGMLHTQISVSLMDCVNFEIMLFWLPQ